MKKNYLLFIITTCFFNINLFGQISGTVFRDINANGIKDNSSTFNEPFLAGITIKAYPVSGSVLTTTSDANGNYNFTGLTLPARIEFSGFLTGDYSAPVGTSNNTSVQFYSAASSGANFGVIYPSNYCQTDPSFVTPKHKNVAVNSYASLVKAPYTATGNNNPGIQTDLAKKSDIGITWGTAYARKNSLIYTSAFVKRHVGSTKDYNNDGKEDIGAIYTVTSTGTSTLWLDLATISGVDVGLSQMPSIAQRALNTTNVSDWSYDDLVFDKIGKIGLGDIDISDDETKLYVVNLFQSKLYTIDIATKTIVSTGTIPSNCTGGNMRAFGLKYYRGNVYVGTVCDAFTSQSATNLTATVYKYDGTTFTSVLSFPLNYPKGPAFINGPPGGPQYGNSWKPWLDDATFTTQFAFTASNGNPAVIYCQPILADLEFDINEDMILTFNDRLGHQTGANNLRPDASHSNTTLYTNVAGGDILRASLVSGTYVLENNGTSGTVSTSGVGNNQGPGGGEFYIGDQSLMYHQESVTGGSMFLAGKNEVVVNVIDPLNFWAEGPRWLSNTTGLELRSYEIRPTSGAFSVEDGGKANGLGDLELLCNPAPIEIGNRVWMDTDSDGVQDADEMGLDNITVKLYNGTTLVATKITANGGQYYFNTADGVLPNTTYTIRIEAASIPSGKFVTLKDQTTGGIQDIGDNDASLVGGNADISYTTGNPGENNHTLDFGFNATVTCSSSVTATPGTCNTSDNKYTLTGQVTLTNPPLTGIVTVQIVGGGNTTFSLPNTSPINYSIAGQSADGASHTVNVSISGVTCTSTVNYTAPASCMAACQPDSLKICAGQSAEYVAPDGYTSYIWYKINGPGDTVQVATGQTFTTSTVGNYIYKATDGSGCPVNLCCPVTVADTTCCVITNLNLVIGNCDNKSTLTNANDDEYTFTLDPIGTGTGSTYTVSGLPNSPQTGTYGSPTTFGPYLISAGVLNISVSDDVASSCSKTASVTPPPSCSVCNVSPPVLSVNDNICPSRTGTINLVQGCGAGTFIQYSINNGSTWSSVKPLYSTTPRTILARCVNSTDTTCKSPNTTVTTAPKPCPPKLGEECTLTANATIDPCNNNGTDDVIADDYFTIQINASVLNGGSSNKYEVVVGADPLTGTGGNVLNSGGTNYGSPVTVGNTKIFEADGTSTYQLVVRDINNNNCFQIINIDPVASCSKAPPKSPCYPVPCVPIGLNKN